jgi:hypothetical protein
MPEHTSDNNKKIAEYNSLFNGKKEAFQTSRYIQDKTIQLYGEYGITELLSLILEDFTIIYPIRYSKNSITHLLA